MTGKPASIHIIRFITQQVKELRIHHSHDEIESIICIGNDHKEGCFPVSDSIQLHFIIRHQVSDLGDIKGSEPGAAGNQYTFCSFARCHLSRVF